MKIFKNYPKFIKYSTITIVCTSVGWILYEVKNTKRMLYEALDPSILNIVEPKPKNYHDKPQQVLNIEYMDFQNVHTPKSSPLWQHLKFSFAQRLVNLCHNENEFIRLKALYRLAKINSMDDWHCSLLANMIDDNTAVHLARIKDVDPRLFTDPPLRYLCYDHNMILDEMKDLLVNLFERSRHPCLEYFISKVFHDQDGGHVVDNDTDPLELTKLFQTNQDLLPICLESILHHASFAKYSKDIVELNGLPLLTELHNIFKNDTNVNITLCRIIFYLSFYPELLDELHKTGWIGILSQWIKHDDIRISVPATCALANLEGGTESYLQHIYLLHPSYISKPPKIDVVFVHGLLGGVFFTWRQRVKSELTAGFMASLTKGLSNKQPKNKNEEIKCSDPITMQYIRDFEEQIEGNLITDFEVVLDDIPVAGNCVSNCGYTCPGDKMTVFEGNDYFTYCWPRDWLPNDCHDLRVIGINYDTSLSMWNPLCPNISGKTNIEQQSNRLLKSMLSAGIGKRPIIWITHSMGGLLVKNILSKAFDSKDPEVSQLCRNTKGIVFYSTPHFGSSLATFNPASQLVLWPSIEVQDLRENSPSLIKIHHQFLNIIDNIPIKVITFAETKKTVFTALKLNFQLVSPHSGNPGVGEYYEIPQDHLGICKPVSRHSFLYRKIVHLIQETLDSIQ